MSIFTSYCANKKTSYKHITECILKDSGLSLILLKRFGISKDDLISDCWSEVWENTESNRVDFQYHREAYSGITIISELEDRKTRKTTSVMVDYFLKRLYFLEKNKKIVRLKKRFIMEESIKEMLENSSAESYSQKSAKLLTELNLTSEETLIYNWKIGLLDIDEVMFVLEVSKRTVHNKWDKLRLKLMEQYYKDEIEDEKKKE